MLLQELSNILVEQKAIASHYLKRYVIVDFYLPKHVNGHDTLSLLLINDGQNLDEMPFAPMLNGLIQSSQISPLFCAGIHCNKDRIEEYGIFDS
jgi:enterochelin esterase-like enzyme